MPNALMASVIIADFIDLQKLAGPLRRIRAAAADKCKQLFGEEAGHWDGGVWNDQNRYDWATFDFLHTWILGVVKRLIRGA